MGCRLGRWSHAPVPSRALIYCLVPHQPLPRSIAISHLHPPPSRASSIVCPRYQLSLISRCPVSQVLTYCCHLLPLSHTLTQTFLPLVSNWASFRFFSTLNIYVCSSLFRVICLHMDISEYLDTVRVRRASVSSGLRLQVLLTYSLPHITC
jgi:hypothetical protein